MDRLDRSPVIDAEALLATVSAYKLTVWSRCQALFFYLYVKGLWGAPSPAILFGSAMDAAQGHGYRDKRDHERNPDPADVQAKFAATFDEEREEVEDWEGQQPGDLLDEGTGIVKTWATKAAPLVRPFDVHKRFSLQIQDFRLTGEVDVTMEFEDQEAVAPAQRGCYVVDNKTSKRRWARSKATEGFQTAMYSIAAGSGALTPKADPSRIGYDVIVRTKKPYTQRMVVGVGNAERQHLVQLIDTARRGWRAAYQSGAFFPNRSHFMCSRRWCPRWRECERDHGGTVKP